MTTALRESQQREADREEERRENLLTAIIGLAALVQHEAAEMHGDIASYGSLRWDPKTPAAKALEERLWELEAFRITPTAEPGEGA